MSGKLLNGTQDEQNKTLLYFPQKVKQITNELQSTFTATSL